MLLSWRAWIWKCGSLLFSFVLQAAKLNSFQAWTDEIPRRADQAPNLVRQVVREGSGETRDERLESEYLRIRGDSMDSDIECTYQLIQKATKASLDTVVNNTLPEIGNDSLQDRQINRETAAAAIVLLKNSANVLPVQFKKGMKIAVLGPNAKSRTVSSGGSAYLASTYVVTAYDAIKEAADEVGAHVEYAAGCYSKSRTSAS
jgi:beta-glucosidase-like glycosyl hydrolase